MPERRPSGFFVLRVPVLPVDVFTGWSEGLSAPGAADLEGAVAQDRTTLRARLRSWVERPGTREAVHLASPDLEGSIDAWLTDPDSPRGARAERALVRYMTRMATRPTPFGLFAASGTGTIGDETDLRIPGPAGLRRHSRLDMHYLDGLARVLADDPAALEARPVEVNPTLYRAGPSLRYVEVRSDARRRSHHLVAVRATPAIEAVVDAARSRPRFADLVELTGDADLVRDLLGAQVLRVDLEPPLTGALPAVGLIEQLRGWPAGERAAEALGAANAGLEQLDAEGIGASPERYEKIAAGLASLPGEVDPALLFQVDLTMEAAGLTLSRADAEEIARAVHVMRILSPGREQPALEGFRRRFEQRFQGREVPLLEALDEEIGVAFEETPDPAPLLGGMTWEPARDASVPMSGVHVLLLRRMEEAVRHGRIEVALPPGEVKSWAGPRVPLPLSFGVMVTLVGGDAPRILIRGAQGPPGARMFGRFCHLDPHLAEQVSRHLAEEEELDPEAIHAEIVHLPHGREGNVLARPVLRAFEIPFLGRSGAPPERQIDPSDLLLSVAGGRLVLRSASLGRRVVPRLTTAHNYARPGLGVYRLLAMLASQHASDHLVWSPGPVGEGSFVPRVRVGRIIVSPARWRLWPDEVRTLRGLRGAALLAGLRDLRSARGLPRVVALTEADNALVADLENVLSAEAWVAALPADSAYVEETFLDPDHLPVEGPDGRYAHELVVPFVATEASPAPAATPSPAPAVRTIPPGGAWLYLKIYTGTATADRLLTDAVAPVAAGALDRGDADRWFFLRYADPDWHLRVRFHGDPRALASVTETMGNALRPFLDEGSVWRIEHGTYEREVERYGGPEGLEAAEAIFHADSDAAVRILGLLEPGDAGSEERWRIALAGAHRLFVDLGLTEDEERDLAGSQARALAEELGATVETTRRIGERYRREGPALSALIDPPPDHPLALGFEVLDRRSEEVAEPAARLRALAGSGDLSQPLPEVARSLVHLHLNRLLRSRQRAQEMVLLALLERVLRTRHHRR